MQGCFSEMLESWSPRCSFFKRVTSNCTPIKGDYTFEEKNSLSAVTNLTLSSRLRAI